MNYLEITGYIASGLVLATFCMRTMIPLRVTAICSNVAFITYGAMGGLIPILVLHTILLPLNVYRTFEMMRLLDRVRRAATGGDLSLEWLKPYMRASTHQKRSVLFSKGDLADRLYVILRGEIELAESGLRISKGDLLGEIGLFSPDRRRTQTAVCTTDTEVLWIDEQELAQLCYANPAMAFYLLRLLTARLMSNIARVEGPGHP